MNSNSSQHHVQLSARSMSGNLWWISPRIDKVPCKPRRMDPMAQGFADKWNFHNCVGAVDGKHVKIQAPPSSGSLYYDNKGTFSMLMAVVDSNYKFMYIDVGANGSFSDPGVFKGTGLYKALEQDKANLPPPQPLPNSQKPVHYHLVGDDAFVMKTWLMKPYSHRKLLKRDEDLQLQAVQLPKSCWKYIWYFITVL